MAFTNVWNDTFPADTELANLLGANLRQARVDLQQRMAAISGLDAAKPNFAGDNTPANWNGILFFATDTGRIYQFNNPAWTDITAGFIFKTAAQKAVTTINHTGTTTTDTIYTLNIAGGVIGVTGRIRMTLNFEDISQGGAATNLLINFGATVLTINIGFLFGAGLPMSLKLVIEGSNKGAANSQLWSTGFMFLNTGSVVGLLPAGGTVGAVDTTAPVVVTLKATNGANTDNQNFFDFTVEIF